MTGPATEKAQRQTCSGNVVARRADGGWQSEDVDDWRCRRTACNSRPDIVEPCAACTGEQSLRACTGPATSIARHLLYGTWSVGHISKTEQDRLVVTVEQC